MPDEFAKLKHGLLLHTTYLGTRVQHARGPGAFELHPGRAAGRPPRIDHSVFYAPLSGQEGVQNKRYGERNPENPQRYEAGKTNAMTTRITPAEA